MHRAIKQADAISAYLEASQLAGFGQQEARKLFGTPPAHLLAITLQPMSARAAEKAFLERHARLFEAHLALCAAPLRGV
jgi:hypothetical protein